MTKAQQNKLDALYLQHVNVLIRQGKAKTTVDMYSRAVRRIGLSGPPCQQIHQGSRSRHWP